MKKDAKTILQTMLTLPVMFFILAGFALAVSCYTASGFGNTGFNGQYQDTGTTNDGKPIYKLDSGHYFVYCSGCGGGPFWTMTTSAGIVGGTLCYLNFSDPPSAGSWVTNDACGTASAGTVVISTCPGGGGGNASSTLVSLDADTKDPFIYFLGFIIFALGFWITRNI